MWVHVKKRKGKTDSGANEKEGIITTEYECSCNDMKEETRCSAPEMKECDAPVMQREPVRNTQPKRRGMLLGFLVFALGITILNTMWNMMEQKIEFANKDIVKTTAEMSKRVEAALASVKAIEEQFASVKATSEMNTKDVASLKTSIGSYSDQTERLELQAKRHADYLKRELRGKQMELRELAELVRFQETLLGESRSGDTREVAASHSAGEDGAPQAGGKIGAKNVEKK